MLMKNVGEGKKMCLCSIIILT